jgi:polysaccharide export outer membrane protein
LAIYLLNTVAMSSYNLTRSLVLLLGSGLCLTNCLAQTPGSADPDAAKPASEVHSSSTAIGDVPAPSIGSQYVLGPADVIRVNVWKSAELSQTVTIGPDGFVSLPLLGDVHAAGLTAHQLALDLGSRYSNYVVSAQVTVSVVDIRSRQVFVTGQVGKPGVYPLVTPITVLQLIAQAGGLNTFANRKGIFILRGGNKERLKFNYNNAIHGDAKQNITLQPGDTVIVP